MGGGGAPPAESMVREQGQTLFNESFPMIDVISGIIQEALGGNFGFFESRGVSSRKASQTAQAGGKRKEETRRGLARQGLEGTGAGQAALTDVQSQTDAAVLDAILSEMEQWINIAPQFALNVANIGAGQGQAAVGAESRRESAGSPLDALVMAAGLAAGTALGGPLGGAIGAGITGVGRAVGGAISPTTSSGPDLSPMTNVPFIG